MDNVRNLEMQVCNRLKDETVKLMAQCRFAVPGHSGVVAEVRRGMVVNCCEGKEVGKVAALAVDSYSQQALCLILGHLPENDGYHSLPVTWIDRIEGDMIFLAVGSDEIQALPNWHLV